jgi:septal ring factor EnvC (AmiA/AmiB activator)
MIHPDATVDECMEEISELEREIERQEKQLYRLGEELAKEKLEIERLRAERDEAHCEIAKLMVALERRRTALRDLVNRWSTKRGFDSAIQRAHRALEDKP